MKLNLGCGSRFNTGWINIDFYSSDPSVRAYNLLQGIPLPDNHVDLVYHSHLLEHFPRDRAGHFLAECMRVLKPGGIIRVAVPDLEQIVRAYLESLNEARAGKNEGTMRYEWMIIELLDQLVRDRSGGEMLKYLSVETVPAKEFILKRLGVEAKRIIENMQNRHDSEAKTIASLAFDYLKNLAISIKKIRIYVTSFLSGIDYASVEIGKFRNSGEVHKWMYDSYSLGRILEASGFVDVIERAATESYIADWINYHLDTEPDGSVYKPDSLYMEGRKSQ